MQQSAGNVTQAARLAKRNRTISTICWPATGCIRKTSRPEIARKKNRRMAKTTISGGAPQAGARGRAPADGRRCLFQPPDEAGNFVPHLAHHDRFAVFDFRCLEIHVRRISVHGDGEPRRVRMSLNPAGFALYGLEVDAGEIEFFTHVSGDLELPLSKALSANRTPPSNTGSSNVTSNDYDC